LILNPVNPNCNPEELMFLSLKSQCDELPTCSTSKSKIQLRNSRPIESDRMLRYGIKKQALFVDVPTGSGTQFKKHTPTSIFIPSTPTSNPTYRFLKTPTSAAARGFKKENKMKLLDMDEVSASIPSKHERENKLAKEKAEREREKAEKETEKIRLKELKEKEIEEKREKKQKKKRKPVDENSESDSNLFLTQNFKGKGRERIRKILTASI
jgi:predicted secreted protein